MRYVLVLIGLLAIQGAAPTTVVDGNWPQWRGPSQDGVSRETGLPSEWGAKCVDPTGLKPAATAEPEPPPTAPPPQGRGRGGFGGGREGQADRPRLLREDGDDEHRVEAAAARLQRVDADCLGRHDLPERRHRRQHRRPGAVGDRSHEADGRMEASARRFEPHGAQAEHVIAVSCHRRAACLGHDRRRRVQSVRLQGQGTLVAQHPDRLRPVRSQLGIRVVAAAQGRRTLRAGAARDEDRRSFVRAEDRQDDRQDPVARRAQDGRRVRVARFVHDTGVDRGQRARRAHHHRRRRRLRPRSRNGQGTGAPTCSIPQREPLLPDRRVADGRRRSHHRADAQQPDGRHAPGRQRRRR